MNCTPQQSKERLQKDKKKRFIEHSVQCAKSKNQKTEILDEKGK